MGLSAVEVVVPDPDQRQDHRQVLLERGLEEVLVHLVSSGEELTEVLGTDEEHDGKPDRTPERVTTADPIPEFKHVGRVDAERFDGFGVGREGDKVLGDVLFLCTSATSVSSLRDDKKERRRTSTADLRNHSLADSALVIVS